MSQQPGAATQPSEQATHQPESIAIEAWEDPVVDALGHDPRSRYVEEFWLGILGPSATWLMRRLVAGLEEAPGGFELDLADEARRLGVGHRGGRHSPFARTLARCVTFGMARPTAPLVLQVRRRLPPLNRRQVLRLSPSLQNAHQRWQEAQLAEHRHPSAGELRQRAVALSLRQGGPGPPAGPGGPGPAPRGGPPRAPAPAPGAPAPGAPPPAARPEETHPAPGSQEALGGTSNLDSSSSMVRTPKPVPPL